jgi:1,2-phenylacetyl-CoA epoxidase catalytic subunit
VADVPNHRAYNTIARDEFPLLMDVERYPKRSPDFEEIIARTEEHFWNPEDPDYIDFRAPWRADEPILPLDFIAELQSAVADRLDDGQKVAFANASAQWTLSNILHGEQGALSLSASLAEMFVDPGAQEYAANQVREEARHVHAFTNYMIARYGGRSLPPGDTLGSLLTTLVTTDVVYKKIVGMQMLVEGLAMGAFATLHTKANDPLLRRLCQLVMTDEAFHHKFGKIWARSTLPELTAEQHEAVEDWAEECFRTLLHNLVNAEQKRILYPRFGLDPAWVQGALLEVFTDEHRRSLMRKSTDVFRTLIKTLLQAGIITERTRATYAQWVDMDELKNEGDTIVGDAIAEEGIQYLKDVNAGKRKIVRKVAAPRA